MSVQVRNARQRLSLLGGDTPKDIGTGEPSFQDVVRLLMAIHLAGDGRTSGGCIDAWNAAPILEVSGQHCHADRSLVKTVLPPSSCPFRLCRQRSCWGACHEAGAAVPAFAAHSSGSTSKDQLARREVTSVSTSAAGWPGNSEAAGKVLGGCAVEQV